MSIRAWFHCLGQVPDPLATGIKTSLIREGVEVDAFDPYRRDGYGVLLFGAFDQAVSEILYDASRGCRERVIAGACERLAPEHARSLIKAGAADVVDCSDCPRSADDILARLARWEVVDRLLQSPTVAQNLVGTSPAWQTALREVVEVAHFTDASMLILGESGTGKEGVARLLHELDPRTHKQDLVILDCSTIVPELSGSEFFGHERGAFTGALKERVGAFAQAHQGTLFLDEVGELPLPLQAQLLRVIQEQTYKRIGGNAWQHTEFRLVAVTNRDLGLAVQRGEFRADLYFRIASFVSRLPPLRDRSEDILPLARHFLGLLSSEQVPPELDPSVQEYLLGRCYPGNIRDLRQTIARLLCHYPGKGPMTVGCIPPEDLHQWSEDQSVWHQGTLEQPIRRALMQGIGLKAISRTAEDTAIRLAVAEANGNLQKAARRLGVTDRTLQLRRAARRSDEGDRTK